MHLLSKTVDEKFTLLTFGTFVFYGCVSCQGSVKSDCSRAQNALRLIIPTTLFLQVEMPN